MRSTGKRLETPLTRQISLPADLVGPIVPTTVLATDRLLTDYEIHPGDELNVLGYPLGFENPGGFPVLRSGKIASYPLVPSSENPFFLLDFRIFKGNSGGPVYWAQTTRWFGGSLRGGNMQMIMGLVSEEVIFTEETRALYENRSQAYPLGLAKIIPATYILETIDRLSLVASN